jgi:phosphatidylserine/phosphatidylglycerophosphate/cardiolipin synthase-like enzyme
LSTRRLDERGRVSADDQDGPERSKRFHRRDLHTKVHRQALEAIPANFAQRWELARTAKTAMLRKSNARAAAKRTSSERQGHLCGKISPPNRSAIVQRSLALTAVAVHQR